VTSCAHPLWAIVVGPGCSPLVALNQDLADLPSAFSIRSSVVATSRVRSVGARTRAGDEQLGDFILMCSDSSPFVRLILTFRLSRSPLGLAQAKTPRCLTCPSPMVRVRPRTQVETANSMHWEPSISWENHAACAVFQVRGVGTPAEIGALVQSVKLRSLGQEPKGGNDLYWGQRVQVTVSSLRQATKVDAAVPPEPCDRSTGWDILR
jgi:hypothetical protein